MAGDWIKVRVDLPDDPAVFSLARSLERSRDEVLGLLVRYWTWVDRHADVTLMSRSERDTFSLSVTMDDVDELVGARGFSQSMVDVGWLGLDEDGRIVVPNHDRHFSKSAKR